MAKEPVSCIRCSKQASETDKYCIDCGAPLQNRCSDEPGLLKKGCTYLNAPNAAYCAKCGEPTLFQLHGLLTPLYPSANKPLISRGIGGQSGWSRSRTDK
ncbi:hypothetical protein J31TS4_14480 [Paenibacillus sp. J31TS4]|uniref:zinc ribbon domain-containing protein n=1 Tax=Paenibacillus sp. J31TS4 TaxID=2807195 RepID=UPI001B1C6C84|nr:zinc ribbon domain-containing protein [Paenibacillus sp. J31TS4]GIP38168.1 hypothetical protein J31TS4_14480 [Paenibacillus sp. J31TS4]